MFIIVVGFILSLLLILGGNPHLVSPPHGGGKKVNTSRQSKICQSTHTTSRVCKFHTCPIILLLSLSLVLSLPSSLSPPPSFPSLSLSLHTYSAPLSHSHLTPNSLRSRKQRRLAENTRTGEKPGSEHSRGLIPFHHPTLLDAGELCFASFRRHFEHV